MTKVRPRNASFVAPFCHPKNRKIGYDTNPAQNERQTCESLSSTRSDTDSSRKTRRVPDKVRNKVRLMCTEQVRETERMI
jgi:hypothetical protein